MKKYNQYLQFSYRWQIERDNRGIINSLDLPDDHPLIIFKDLSVYTGYVVGGDHVRWMCD